jgi:hypothetical protein
MRIAARMAGGLVVAGLTVLGSAPAWAGPGDYGDPFMKDLNETVYATNHHMAFSMRSSVIRWLGGLPIVDDRDVRAAERERWWGPAVPNLPAATAREITGTR